MAINPKLKAMIEGRTDMTPEYKEQLIKTMENAPADFQNNWMSQQDYSRQTSEFQKEKEVWSAEAKQFYEKSNTAIESWKTEVSNANTAKDQALARIAELEGRIAGGGMPNVPGGAGEALVKEINGLKTLVTTLDSRIAKLDNVVTKEQLGEAYQGAVGFLGEQMLELTEISERHQERFGKRFDKTNKAELIEFANKKAKELNRSLSLEEAYNMKYGTDLEALKEKEIEARVEERLKSQMHVPGAADGGAAGGAPTERGPMQIRIDQERQRAAGVTDPTKGGYATWQEAAAAGAQELVTEGKY